MQVTGPRGVLWETQIGKDANFGVNVDEPGRYYICFNDLSGHGGVYLIDPNSLFSPFSLFS